MCFSKLPAMPADRRAGFVLGKGVPQPPPKKVPKAVELTMDDGTLPSPSAVTLAFFTSQSDFWIAIDVETHDLIPNTNDVGWVLGQYGHSCRIDGPTIVDLRIVQIGWCIGRCSSTNGPVVKSSLIKPDGFSISAAATAKHRITQEAAIANGKPLAIALHELLKDASAVTQDGGRLCAHQFTSAVVLSLR